jgi:hypothetical protein
MIEMLRIYSKGFLENVTIEELPPYSIHHAGQYSSAKKEKGTVLFSGIENLK